MKPVKITTFSVQIQVISCICLIARYKSKYESKHSVITKATISRLLILGMQQYLISYQTVRPVGPVWFDTQRQTTVFRYVSASAKTSSELGTAAHIVQVDRLRSRG